MKNQFRVSDTLRDYVENVLRRRAIPYRIEDGKCETDISGEKFHKVVLRAKMEKETDERGSNFPLIAEKELFDETVLSEVGDDYITVH